MSEHGRRFRAAWIEGVNRYFPDAKPGYTVPWEDMGEWEQLSAEAVYGQVAEFIKVSGGATAKLSREQRGRFVSICWNAQVFKHFGDPKPSYVADWTELPEWQQETDSDIFDSIEKAELE